MVVVEAELNFGLGELAWVTALKHPCDAALKAFSPHFFAVGFLEFQGTLRDTWKKLTTSGFGNSFVTDSGHDTDLAIGISKPDKFGDALFFGFGYGRRSARARHRTKISKGSRSRKNSVERDRRINPSAMRREMAWIFCSGSSG